MDMMVFAVTRGGSFKGSTVLTNMSIAANCEGSLSQSYLRASLSR